MLYGYFFFFSSRRRHTRLTCDWSSDVCSSDLRRVGIAEGGTEVKGDFILTPNVPSMVAPGDEFSVSVGVFNNTVGDRKSTRLNSSHMSISYAVFCLKKKKKYKKQ